MSDIILLDRFFRKVQLHLAACYGDVARWPVILGIFGRSGDGKSVQLTVALENCQVEIVRLNAADLESGLAGEPGKYIARTYATASMAVAKDVPVAIVVDDIDTTVGEWEMNTGTVNHQQVLAELMHIADQPVDHARNFPRRVPVFVTGNNLKRLYPPLRRPGRMNTFVWSPEPGEVRAVVEGIFGHGADNATIDELTREFGAEPLAFFARVRQEILHREMSEQLLSGGYDMRRFLRKSHNNHSNGARRRLSGPEVLQVARAVWAEQQAVLADFLESHGAGGYR